MCVGLKVPMNRRRQTAAVLAFMCILPISLGCYFLTAWLFYASYYNYFPYSIVTHYSGVAFPYTLIPLVVYIVWLVWIDKAPQTGSRTASFRKWGMWNHFRDYFPIDLHKTTDLDPKAGEYPPFV